MLKDRFISLMAVLGTGFLLLISLVISAALSAMGARLEHLLPGPEILLHILNFLVSFAVITLLFAMIYKLLPDTPIRWGDVWIGASITSLLFTIGKFFIGLYLGKSDVGLAYGTAGSLVVILIWVYYASQIFLFGAEFTAVYAEGHSAGQQTFSRPKRRMSFARMGSMQSPTLKERGGELSQRPRRHRIWAIAGTVVGLLIMAVLVVAFLLSTPLKHYAEREARERLSDFEITIGTLHVQPLRLALDVQDVAVRLRANPDPPLAVIPHLKADVGLLLLLTGKFNVTLQIEHPEFAATSQQVDSILHTPKKEEVKQQAVAWQDTLREMMPIRVSLSISDGHVWYQSEPTIKPIEVHALEVTAANITNRPADKESYPSELRVTARLEDEAEVALESRADFLVKPSPRIDGELKVQHLRLPTLLPITGQYNVQLRQGAFEMTSHVKYDAPTMVVNVHDFVLEDAKVDYVHQAHTKNKEIKRAKKGAENIKEVHRDPSVVVKISHGKILHSDVGFINKSASPDYRVFLSDLNLELENFSNRPEEGMGTVKLTGNFMGSGPTMVTGSFRPEKPNPDFDVQVRIVKTQATSLNKLLEAYGHLNAKQGTFAFFSDMAVKDNRIDGYLKPFLKDVQVYDPTQDKDKAASQKVYEAVVNGVLDLFKSTPTGQVATETDVSGPIENPRTSTWQILEKLVQNAFFKAILPGFKESRKV
jgi:hypothetical protein